MRVAALTTLAAFVLSLAPADGGALGWTAVPLPEAALTRVPVLDNTIAARYSLYVMLGAAVIFALTIEALREHLRRDGQRPERVAAACAALACLALLPLVPAWPYWVRIAQVPRYFSSAQVSVIPPGGVVVLYPFPASDDALPMLGQVAAGMRFKSPGGRFVIPAPGLSGTPASDQQTLTGQTLARLAAGQMPALTPSYGGRCGINCRPGRASRPGSADRATAWPGRTVLRVAARPSARRRSGGISAWYE